jgi:hypothetical protein
MTSPFCCSVICVDRSRAPYHPIAGLSLPTREVGGAIQVCLLGAG